MSALLEIRDLIVRRDKRQVLKIDHLTVEKDEVLAIVGPNGTGKSSFLLTLARLLQPENGELLWDGIPFTEQTNLAYRRRIALVLQEPLLLDVSVFENVAIGLRYRGIPSAEVKDKVNRWLARVGIESLRSRPGAKLSGGEAQRVSLARAFVLNPELLLLDEPFSALDAPTRLRLLDDLKSILAETSTTTIFITHDLKEATRLASRVAVMLGGQIVQVGAPQDVFASPANQDVAAFLGI
jgi:tungstate transport system ATP-binding protein